MSQIPCQQPGIGRIRLVAQIDRFAVVSQLARVDQKDLEAQCKGLFDHFQVIN